MRLDLVVEEVYGVFATVDGINVAPDGAGVLATPPAPYVELPELVFGEYGAGLDRLTMMVTVVFGPANNTQTFTKALQYASSSGPLSIRAALRAHSWSTCSTLFVRRAEPTITESRASNPELGYTFHLDISGRPA